jgi:general secretion pathway protein A
MTRHPLYRSFFGFNREPFAIELKVEEILTTPALSDFTERFDYVLRLGAIGLLTGEVGAGKSTALRFASSRLHPSQYHTLWLTASGGSILETYRQLAAALDVETKSFSRAALTRIIRHGIYVFDFTEGTHPISRKGTTEIGGAKRRSDLHCLH